MSENWRVNLVDEPGFNGVVVTQGDYADEPSVVIHVAHAVAPDGSDDRERLAAHLVTLLTQDQAASQPTEGSEKR